MEDHISNKKFVISGDGVMLERHYLFINCFKKYFRNFATVSTPNLSIGKRILITETLNGFPLCSYLRFPGSYDQHKSTWAFDYKSAVLGRTLRKQDPDFVLHIFSMSCPVPKTSKIPYAITLDYTMALAQRNYPDWAKFPNESERKRWFKREQDAYKRAAFLFPWSKSVADSLQNDYGVTAEKMVVTGSSGNLRPAFNEVKTFGSYSILMNVSDFLRKGGDIALEAFQIVLEKIPQANLVLVGLKDGPKGKNVFYKGNVSNKDEMKRLFLEADVVLGPARCDPYPGFIIEAMGFGTPCIVSNRDGMPEIVDHNVNGIVLPELNPAVLADSIINLLEDTDKLKRFSIAAKNKVSTKLNWEQLAKTVVDTVGKI